MDLIVKPSSACNFKCTFCSSTEIGDQPTDTLGLEEVERFLVRFPNTNTIIINGGDPLMMPPEYYWGMIEIIERLGSSATISLTTNLWAFYKKPQLWVELFKHPLIGVSTSFQYGDARLKGDLTPYTEAEFIAVSDMMLELVGYRPHFITVIGKDNEHTVLDTVRLAKRLDVQAKINKVYTSGPELQYKGITMGAINQFYSLADIYEKYLEIYDAGLAEWDYNTLQMTTVLQGKATTCPLSRTCDETIRNLQPSGRYFSCGSFGDDNLFGIDYEREMAGEFFTPLQSEPELASMKDSCYSCPMFSICNGCRKTVNDTKKMGQVENHCRKMKTLAPRIIEINGLSDLLEPTPYVDESIGELIFKG